MILPLAVPGQFTYALPELIGKVELGMRVVVPFGRGRKLYSGLVQKIHDERPRYKNVREVVSVLDTVPIVSRQQLDLWDRMADHYLCTLGEVMIAALPAQLSLSSETRLIAAADIAEKPAPNARAVLLLDALELRQVITLDEAGELLGLKDPMPMVKALMDSGHLLLEEELRNTWKPRTYTYVKLAEASSSEEALHRWFDKLERAPKQLHVLMRFIELSRCLSNAPLEVDRTKLVHASGASTAVVKQLVDKGIFELYEREAGAPSK
ncbi:MAG: hypothetical protein WAR83_01350, partial [Flavobacteriales bacterium]